MPFPKPRRLSKKKIRKSITLPEYLDDWIERYLKYEREQQQQKRGKVENDVKSYSSFITKTLENVMNLFLKGKNFKDLEVAVDNRMNNFYEKITFRALIIYYEFLTRLSKYIKFDLKRFLNVFMMYHNVFTRGKTITEEDAVITLNRFKNFMINNKTTKDIMIERSGNKYIFQYFGIYPEMHYDFSKWIAGILAFLGLEIKKMSHSSNYTRMDFEITEIFKVNDAVLEDRIKLFNYNTDYFTNYSKILEDEDNIHLWIRLNKSDLPIISFRNIEDGLVIIREIISDLNKWISPREFKVKLLELYKKLRWINNVNETKLSFQLLIDKYSTEYNIMKIIFDELKLEFEESENSIFLK